MDVQIKFRKNASFAHHAVRAREHLVQHLQRGKKRKARHQQAYHDPRETRSRHDGQRTHFATHVRYALLEQSEASALRQGWEKHAHPSRSDIAMPQAVSHNDGS